AHAFLAQHARQVIALIGHVGDAALLLHIEAHVIGLRETLPEQKDGPFGWLVGHACMRLWVTVPAISAAITATTPATQKLTAGDARKTANAVTTNAPTATPPTRKRLPTSAIFASAIRLASASVIVR